MIQDKMAVLDDGTTVTHHCGTPCEWVRGDGFMKPMLVVCPACRSDPVPVKVVVCTTLSTVPYDSVLPGNGAAD